MKNRKSRVAAITLIVAAGALSYAYLSRTLPDVTGLRFGRQAEAILEIGATSYAWGGSVASVCTDGRIYVAPTGTGGDPYGRGAARLVAVIPEDAAENLDETLGRVSFDYAEEFDEHGAFDAAFRAFASRDRGAVTMDFNDADYGHYRALVDQLIAAYPARISAGTLAMTLARKEPVHFWPADLVVDLSAYAGAGVGEHDGFSLTDTHQGDLEVTIDPSGLSEDGLAAFSAVRDEHTDEMGPDNAMYNGWGDAFFRMPGDGTVVYQTFMPTDGEGELAAVTLRVKPGVMPAADLAALYGGTGQELLSALGSWETGSAEERMLAVGAAERLASMVRPDGTVRVATTDGDPDMYAEFRVDVLPSPAISVPEDRSVCGSPWPDGLVASAPEPSAVAITPPTGYAERADIAEREAESRAEGQRTAELGETFPLRYPGDEVTVADGDVTVRAVEVGEYCDWSPDVIDFEFVTSDPSSCPEGHLRPYLRKMSAVIGGEQQDVPITLTDRTSSGITAASGDRLYRIVVQDHTVLVKVMDLIETCAAYGDPQERNYCWFSAAEDTGDHSLCLRLVASYPGETDIERQDGCRRLIGTRTRDKGACEAIMDPGVRDACLETLAFDVPELCDEVASPAAFCRCHRLSDRLGRRLCLERTIYEFPFTASSPFGYCDRLDWTRGSCALGDILMGYPVCLEADADGCTREIRSTGIGNCADLADRDLENECYRRFIDANRPYSARPQGAAVCDAIADAGRRDRCRNAAEEYDIDGP